MIRMTGAGLLLSVLLLHGSVLATQAVPTPSPKSEGIANKNQSEEKSLWGLHGDTLVFVATVCVALATIVLCKATFDLAKITKQHVEHSKRLVEEVERMYKAGTTAQIAITFAHDGKDGLIVVARNIGRVPSILNSLTVDIMAANPEHCQFPQQKNVWLIPGERIEITHPSLSRIWYRGDWKSLSVKWTFSDEVVHSGGESVPRHEVWLKTDHQSIARGVAK